jgi:dTDP-glucose pyrophosphorylase
VRTVLVAAEFIKDDEPVIVSHCDAGVFWDYADFKQQMAERACAGCMTAFRGFHPHSLGPTYYAYIHQVDGYLQEIREKEAFTDQRMQEYASTGVYYYRSGALLKHYAQLAVERALRVNGEFYLSLPYNLLVSDGLDVFIYPVDYFLHWGVPQDLEEYAAWSDYFARYVDWQPSHTPLAGINLIPMAGAGARFSQAGYAEPKPLVPVGGVPMIRRALDSFPSAQSWITACRTEHLTTSPLAAVLQSNGHQIDILPVERLTEGQASTCLLARERIDPAAPLLIAPCDAALVFDQARYAQLTADPTVDCLVWTFRNHPHANRYPTQYGWVRATDAG